MAVDTSSEGEAHVQAEAKQPHRRVLRPLRLRLRPGVPGEQGARAGSAGRAPAHRTNRVSATLEQPVACCAPLAASTLTDEEAEATAELFKALGDPARVRLVNLIATNDG